MLEWAAENFGDDEFRDYYAHRAARLLKLHGEALAPAARKRLEALAG